MPGSGKGKNGTGPRTPRAKLSGIPDMAPEAGFGFSNVQPARP